MTITPSGYVGINQKSPSYLLDVNGSMSATGYRHSSVNSDSYVLLAGGGYKALSDFSMGTPTALAYSGMGSSCFTVAQTDGSFKGKSG